MKKYDFRLVVRKAELSAKYAVICMGGDGVYHAECMEATLAEALKRQNELSALEPRQHAVLLTMKYRDDRKPVGFKKVVPVYGGTK